MSNLSVEDVHESWAESLRQRAVHSHLRYKVSWSLSLSGR